MTDSNITPFPQPTKEPPKSLFENPTVPEAMDTLMMWSEWRLLGEGVSPFEYYRLLQLRDAIIHLGGDRHGSDPLSPK